MNLSRRRSVLLPMLEARLAAVALQSTNSPVVKQAEEEKLRQELFSNPAGWRDNRSAYPSVPDFSHKNHMHKALGRHSEWSPPWVQAKLGAKGPQASEFTLSSEGTTGVGGKQVEVEKLWRELFSDPTDWRDHRADKANPSFPDFKHTKHSEKALWLNSKWIPPWVEEKLAALSPGSIQLSTFSRNQQLSRYVQAGQYEKTIEIFQQMHQEGNADRFTFVPVLKACANLGFLEQGRRVHAMMPPGFEADMFIGNTLIDMYAKCGSTEEAERLFKQMPTRSVVTLTAMIGGYVKCGQGQKALELFEQMEGQGIVPDPVAFVGVLNACASLEALEVGRRAHEEIIRRGYESDVVVGTCLVDMYAKCGSIEEAEKLFKQMHKRNVVTFSAMIGGYVKCGEGQKALELFEQMRGQGVDLDPVLFVGVLNACASVAALEAGRRAHEEIIRRGYESDVVVGTCLVDMYAKCGSIKEAEMAFNDMTTKDVVAWNAMLTGYGLHGYARRALETFKEMFKVVEVNGVTFLSLLSACTHGGLVAEGLDYFKSMSAVYKIVPTVEHFARVVNLLGRAGHLGEAEDLIMSIPGSNACVWMALLGACSSHVNVEVGERCAERVLESEPDNAAAYVLLSNIYVAAGKFDSIARLNEERLCRGVKKTPGRTWIEVNSQLHSFTVDDEIHPQIVSIRSELERLSHKLKDSGYFQDARFVLDTISLQCVNKEEKEFHLCHHSEMLAIAFGLISTAHGNPLRIVKNLQMCSDCHAATKFIAKMVGRAITVRDAVRFHRFQDGLCSCRDYW